MDAKRDLKLSKALFTSKWASFNLLEREPAFTSEMFQDTLLPGSELWPVCFNKRQQNEEAFF